MYCTRCGRKLEEGEVCTCTQDQKNKKVQEKAPTQSSNENQKAVETAQEQSSKQAEWLQESGTQALKCIKEFLGKVLQILKKPVSETERLAAENTKTTSMQFILVKAAIVLILVLVTTAGIRKEYGGMIEVPYASVLILTLLTTIGYDCMEAHFMNFFGRAFGGITSVNNMYCVVGVRAVFDFVLMVVTAILSVFSDSLAVCVYLGIMMLIPFVQFASFRAAINADENKKVYAFFVSKLCSILIIGILVYLIGKDTLNDMMSTLSSGFYSAF